MKILVVNADCVFVNTSANLCHLAYLKGLAEAGHQIELLCADSNHRNIDPNMVLPKNIQCRTYPGLSLYERMSIRYAHKPMDNVNPISSTNSAEKKLTFSKQIVQFAKHFSLSVYGVHGIYSTFVRKAFAFYGSAEYDYVISISTPAASHLLAYRLLKRKHIVAKHWIQIWEDPWASDAYGFNERNKVFKEEKRLLDLAEKICYVSPLTLRNQQRLFPESAEKMFWQPLPYYYKSECAGQSKCSHRTYGYFGAYYPAARDLKPFYDAARKTGAEVNICGDPSNLFSATAQIHIYPRLSLLDLKPFENSADVLVFLCNRRGGQIPGKIYQYSATDKTILFILDGTEEEQIVLKEYFGKFNRYVFCKNTVEDIASAIQRIELGNIGSIQNIPLDDFKPERIVTNILEAAK